MLENAKAFSGFAVDDVRTSASVLRRDAGVADIPRTTDC